MRSPAQTRGPRRSRGNMSEDGREARAGSGQCSGGHEMHTRPLPGGPSLPLPWTVQMAWAWVRKCGCHCRLWQQQCGRRPWLSPGPLGWLQADWSRGCVLEERVLGAGSPHRHWGWHICPRGCAGNDWLSSECRPKRGSVGTAANGHVGREAAVSSLARPWVGSEPCGRRRMQEESEGSLSLAWGQGDGMGSGWAGAHACLIGASHSLVLKGCLA